MGILIYAGGLIGFLMIAGLAARISESKNLPEGLKLVLILLVIFGIPILIALLR